MKANELIIRDWVLDGNVYAQITSITKVRPKIGEMTNLMMDCYQQGFKDCWKVLTGKEF